MDDRSQLTAQLTETLFPVLIEIYSASAGPGVKHASLQVCLRNQSYWKRNFPINPHVRLSVGLLVVLS